MLEFDSKVEAIEALKGELYSAIEQLNQLAHSETLPATQCTEESIEQADSLTVTEEAAEWETEQEKVSVPHESGDSSEQQEEG